jgi:Superinfection immunity protein
VYLLPTLIGMARHVERLALVFLVNLIGGPTGIGWLAAMSSHSGRVGLPPHRRCL